MWDRWILHCGPQGPLTGPDAVVVHCRDESHARWNSGISSSCFMSGIDRLLQWPLSRTYAAPRAWQQAGVDAFFRVKNERVTVIEVISTCYWLYVYCRTLTAICLRWWRKIVMTVLFIWVYALIGKHPTNIWACEEVASPNKHLSFDLPISSYFGTS